VSNSDILRVRQGTGLMGDRKKQFNHRIRQWGLEKNVKRKERRAILESVDGEGQFEERVWRGRKLDKAKIERWRKREQLKVAGCSALPELDVGGEGEAMENVPRVAERSKLIDQERSSHRGGAYLPAMEMEISTQDVPLEEVVRFGEHGRPMTMDESTFMLRGGGFPVSPEIGILNEYDTSEVSTSHEQQNGSILMGQEQIFNPWLAVNVVGSPGLTGLIGALTIDCCENIPDLDLPAPYLEEGEEICDLMDPDQNACSDKVSKKAWKQRHPPKKTSPSSSFTISNLPTYILSMQRQSRMPSPLDELYPFPNSVPRRRIFFENLRTDHLMSTSSLQRKELECRAKFKALKSMKPSAIIDLVNDMRSIAWRHYELDQYPESERWWRRVVTSSLKVQGHDPFDILRACLWIIDSLCFQCRYKEALSLHYSIHCRIMKLVGLEHELAMISRRKLGFILRLLGEREREIEIFRELLQICLCRYGTRSRDTLDIIQSLGYALHASGQHEEAATIFCICIQLDCVISPYTARTMIDDQNALQVMSMWAICLNKLQRYEDSTTVWNTAERWFKDSMGLESPLYWEYLGEKAQILGLEGQLLESEAILRTILTHTPGHPDLDIINATYRLANLLQDTGRVEEAVPLWEKIFLEDTEIYGIAHKYTISECGDLGFCYAELGRYDDAVRHFQQTIEILHLIEDGDPASRDAYTQDLRGWISEVEEMKEEAEVLEIQPLLEEEPQNFTGMSSLDEPSIF
jgi:tetratricopeptide (TPR) repeat protein